MFPMSKTPGNLKKVNPLSRLIFAMCLSELFHTNCQRGAYLLEIYILRLVYFNNSAIRFLGRDDSSINVAGN